MYRIVEILDNQANNQDDYAFKNTLIKLFSEKIIENPFIPIGRYQPYEVVISLHNTTNSLALIQRLKLLLNELLLEYYNTTQINIIYQVLKCSEEIKYNQFLKTTLLILEKESLKFKRYNNINLELLLINNLKAYKIGKNVRNNLLYVLLNNYEIEHINHYLDLFINLNFKKGILKCIELVANIDTSEASEYFITQYISSYDSLTGKDLILQYEDLKRRPNIDKIRKLFLLLNYAYIEDYDWDYESYNHAIICIIKKESETLTFNDYAKFVQHSINEEKLLFMINSLLADNEMYSKYVEDVQTTLEYTPTIYRHMTKSISS